MAWSAGRWARLGASAAPRTKLGLPFTVVVVNSPASRNGCVAVARRDDRPLQPNPKVDLP